jgi:hypothetical protein
LDIIREIYREKISAHFSPNATESVSLAFGRSIERSGYQGKPMVSSLI